MPLMQVIVTVGVALSSYGEVRFVILGVILQVCATVLESTRLILVQVLLQVCFPISSVSGLPLATAEGQMERKSDHSFTIRRSAPYDPVVLSSTACQAHGLLIKAEMFICLMALHSRHELQAGSLAASCQDNAP